MDSMIQHRRMSVSNAGGTRSVENLDLSLWDSLSLRGDEIIYLRKLVCFITTDKVRPD